MKVREREGRKGEKEEKKTEADRGRLRRRKRRNRDITFARYRLIGITRFPIVSGERRSSDPALSLPLRSALLPFVVHCGGLCGGRLSHDSVDVQSTEVGCNYRLSITNVGLHAVSTRSGLTRSLLTHWRDKFTPRVPFAFFSFRANRGLLPRQVADSFSSPFSRCSDSPAFPPSIVKRFHIASATCSDEVFVEQP